jgi:hypothetical protein
MHKECVLCELETDFVVLIYMDVNIHRSCHDSGAGFSSRRSGFCRRLFHVEFVVDKVAKGQGFLRIFRVFHQCAVVIFILILLLPERQAGETCKTSNMAIFLQIRNMKYWRSLDRKLYSGRQSAENQITF